MHELQVRHQGTRYLRGTRALTEQNSVTAEGVGRLVAVRIYLWG